MEFVPVSGTLQILSWNPAIPENTFFKSTLNTSRKNFPISHFPVSQLYLLLNPNTNKSPASYQKPLLTLPPGSLFTTQTRQVQLMT